MTTEPNSLSIYTAVVGTVSALAAAGGFIFLLWRWREEKKSKSLVTRLHLAKDDGARNGWRQLTATLRSRDDVGYTATSLSILWPLSGRIASYWSGLAEHPEGLMHGHVPCVPTKASKKLEIEIAVAHAGQETVRGGHRQIIKPGDQHSDNFFAYRKGRGRMIVKMKITREDDGSLFARYLILRF